MKVIGITGGVGSGKSAVLKLLEEEYHAVVVQLDEVAKALQRKGTPCWKAIVEAFGREILDENEELDRKKLAQIVFQSSEKLEQLNGIVHPAGASGYRRKKKREDRAVRTGGCSSSGSRICQNLRRNMVYLYRGIGKKRAAESIPGI